MRRRILGVVFVLAGLTLSGGLGAQTKGGEAPPAKGEAAGASEAADPALRDDGRAPRVLRIELDGAIIPGTADYILDAVDHAEREDYEALLLVLHTPGGMLDATREIARGFLDAEVPVVVYVSPPGSHAASAGMFITIAAHVAAMAPGTNIGAAHPVTGGGQDVEEQAGEDMAKKVENDTAAFARSVAQQRGRNVEWAEKAVRESVSATADEAKELGVIDVIARTQTDLLDAIDGRTVTLPGDREVVLHTAGAKVDPFDMTVSQKVLSVLGHPNVLAILGLLGVLGILIEIYNPGLIVPGAVGVLSLLLSGIGYAILPVNVGAALLFLAGLALFVAEVHVTSFGLLTLAGAACAALGASLLINTSDPDFYVDPSFSVSWGVILPTILGMGAVVMGMMFMMIRTQRRQPKTGSEGIVGELGRARSEVTRDGGTVFVHGELWRAVARNTVAKGESIKVVGIDGLTLEVVAHPPA